MPPKPPGHSPWSTRDRPAAVDPYPLGPRYRTIARTIFALLDLLASAPGRASFVKRHLDQQCLRGDPTNSSGLKGHRD
jgi:hypothetical protein